MRQALERRLGIVFGSGVVILFLIGALQNRSAIKLAGAIRDVTQSHETLENLAKLDSLVSDAALGADGYVMSGNAADLQSYRDAATGVPRVLRKLQSPAGRNPEQTEEWTALASQTTAALAGLQKAVDGHAASLRSSDPSLLANRQATDDARQTIRGMQEKERRLLSRRNGAVTANSRLATLCNALGAALALWLVIVASLVIHRYVDERRRSGGTQVLAMEALRNLGQAVYLADETGMVLYANRAADAMFGYEAGKLVGMDIGKLNDLSEAEDGLARGRQIQARLIAGLAWSGTLTSYKKDRTSFPSWARVSTLELSGRGYRLFVQDDLSEPRQCNDSSESDPKHSPPMLEPSGPLPVASAGQ